MKRFDLPEEVRRRVQYLGREAIAWLDALPGIVDELCTEWQLTPGAVLGGGSASCALDVTMANGERAVLKIPVPGNDPARAEARVLGAANGRGYVRALRYDERHGALLLEKLGPALESLGLSVEDQIAHLCRTLQRAWRVRPPDDAFTNGARKAADLAAFISTTWRELGEPCAERVIETALRLADERRGAFDARRAVLAHADAHAANALLLPGTDPLQFKLIDPEGLFIEPAYDLAIPMREWGDELMRGDAVALGRARCLLLSRLTGVEPEPIWQWGFIERTSSGLLLLKLGLSALAEPYLRVAEIWAAHPSF